MPSPRPADPRQPFSPSREPKRLLAVSLFMMALATGCGPVSAEEEDASPQEAVDMGAPQPAPEEEGNVSAMALCCFAKCADGAGNLWRGPFRSVLKGNCANYAHYYCGQHQWPYISNKWDNC